MQRANLAVLRGEKRKEMKQRDNELLAWSGAGSPNAKALDYDPSKEAAFPKDFVVSEYTQPRWSEHGSSPSRLTARNVSCIIMS